MPNNPVFRKLNGKKAPSEGPEGKAEGLLLYLLAGIKLFCHKRLAVKGKYRVSQYPTLCDGSVDGRFKLYFYLNIAASALFGQQAVLFAPRA